MLSSSDQRDGTFGGASLATARPEPSEDDYRRRRRRCRVVTRSQGNDDAKEEAADVVRHHRTVKRRRRRRGDGSCGRRFFSSVVRTRRLAWFYAALYAYVVAVFSPPAANTSSSLLFAAGAALDNDPTGDPVVVDVPKFYVDNYCDADAWVIYKKMDETSRIPTKKKMVYRMHRQEMDCYSGRELKVQVLDDEGLANCTARTNPFHCRAAPDVPVVRIDCDYNAVDGPRRCAAIEIHEQCYSFAVDMDAFCPARSEPIVNASVFDDASEGCAATVDGRDAGFAAIASVDASLSAGASSGRADDDGPTTVTTGAFVDSATQCPICACKGDAVCATHADDTATCGAVACGLPAASRSSRTACVPPAWKDLTSPPTTAAPSLDEPHDDDDNATLTPTPFSDRKKKGAAQARRAANMAAFVIAFLAAGIAACAIRQALVKQRGGAPRSGLYVDIPSDVADLRAGGRRRAGPPSSTRSGVLGGIEMMMSGGSLPDGL